MSIWLILTFPLNKIKNMFLCTKVESYRMFKYFAMPISPHW